MICDEISELLPAYQDGELAPERQENVERHLAQCPTCRQVLKELKLVESALDELPGLKPSESFTDEVLKKTSVLKKRRMFLAERAWACAAAAVVAIAVGLWVVVIAPGEPSKRFVELPNLDLLEDEEYLGLGELETEISGDLELEVLDLEEPA